MNSVGQVVGINSAIATLGAASGTQSGSIGLGFAIPINVAKRISDEIVATGKATTPIMGITLTENDTNGATIRTVTPGSPAATAGLKPGDVITKIDGTPLQDSTELLARIRSHEPSDTIVLTVNEGDKSRNVTVTLGTKAD